MYVYFAQQCDHAGNVKIGKSRDVDARIKALQTGSGSKLKLLHSVFVGSDAAAFEVERSLHEMFGWNRKRGEFFGNSALLRELIAALAAGVNVHKAMAEVSKRCHKKTIRRQNTIANPRPIDGMNAAGRRKAKRRIA